ncbi:hypothetical protein K0M31_001392 [Melipona bicolor]|uniref:Uncharacterized protein n=1 Tax=Melipona bicolor TaxID=60889 RepID=A0AA40GFM8_9HYME|nr:hypothetical protein K0M31_001392 [Melipona bicolor]
MFGLFVQVKGDEDCFYVVGIRLCAGSRLEKAVLIGPDQDGAPPGTHRSVDVGERYSSRMEVLL